MASFASYQLILLEEGIEFVCRLNVSNNLKFKDGEGLLIYDERMKIEESFRDLKRLLNLEKVMNKKRENMEKVIA
jgi:transposase